MLNLASLNARLTGSSHLFNRCLVKSWNLARLRVVSKLTGPLALIAKNGKEITVLSELDNSIFAFSAASLILARAALSVISNPDSILICVLIQSAKTLSQSSPPSLLTPAVEITSNVPSPISRIDTSNVPPPKSKTKIFSDLSVAKP